MKLVNVEDLKPNRYYILYDDGDVYKVLMIIGTTGILTDNSINGTDVRYRWEIKGKGLAEYQTNISSGDVQFTMNDPDDYNEGFQFMDNDVALIWELSDDEVNIHLINHI